MASLSSGRIGAALVQAGLSNFVSLFSNISEQAFCALTLADLGRLGVEASSDRQALHRVAAQLKASAPSPPPQRRGSKPQPAAAIEVQAELIDLDNHDADLLAHVGGLDPHLERTCCRVCCVCARWAPQAAPRRAAAGAQGRQWPHALICACRGAREGRQGSRARRATCGWGARLPWRGALCSAHGSITVNRERAISALHTPSAWGGGVPQQASCPRRERGGPHPPGHLPLAPRLCRRAGQPCSSRPWATTATAAAAPPPPRRRSRRPSSRSWRRRRRSSSSSKAAGWRCLTRAPTLPRSGSWCASAPSTARCACAQRAVSAAWPPRAERCQPSKRDVRRRPASLRARSAAGGRACGWRAQEKERGEEDIVDCFMERSCIVVNETKLKVRGTPGSLLLLLLLHRAPTAGAW